MKSAALDSLIQHVLKDELIQTELRQITDRQAFVSRIVELGIQIGHDVTADAVDEAMRANRKKWLGM